MGLVDVGSSFFPFLSVDLFVNFYFIYFCMAWHRSFCACADLLIFPINNKANECSNERDLAAIYVISNESSGMNGNIDISYMNE